MALPKSYTNNYGKLSQLFEKIREGTAPDIFSRQHLKDLGFKSSHDRAMVPILKELGFLSSDGKPTSRYMSFLDKSRATQVLTNAVKEVYRDLFVLKSQPTKSDMDAIAGKFKSEFNSSDAVAKYRAANFFALLDLCDLSDTAVTPPPKIDIHKDEPKHETEKSQKHTSSSVKSAELHYNIQIHLPATKDLEVYNAIFKSLKEHLIE